MTKFYGIWLPGAGWLRIQREEPTGYHKSVCWASTDKALARYWARKLGGRVEPVDLALGEEDAQNILLAAEKKGGEAKESLWHKIIKEFRRVSSTN